MPAASPPRIPKPITTRKIKNRGYQCVHWHSDEAVHSGFIWKQTRVHVWFWSASTGPRKLRQEERRHMREF